MTNPLGNRKTRNFALQALFLAIIGAMVVTAVVTARRNLQIQGVTVGWDFLHYTTGVSLTFTLIPYDITSTFAQALLVGIVNTLLLGGISVPLAVVLGTLIGTARLSSNRMLSWIASWYIQLFRNLPLILQAFFWYTLVTHLPPPRRAISLPGDVFISNRGVFLPILNVDLAHVASAIAIILLSVLGSILVSSLVSKAWGRTAFGTGLLLSVAVLWVGWQPGAPLFDFPTLHGLKFVGGGTIVPELTAAITAISLFGASYVAEIVRSGFLAIPSGQIEAAHALGLRDWAIFWKIKLPLMIRIVLPTMTNQIIWLMKATTIGIAIGFTDFFAAIAMAINNTGQTLSLIFILIIGFWIINMTISVVMNSINRAIAIPGRKS